MKVAIYARVSTIDKGQDPETQMMPLREYCNRMGWQFDEYIDFASGVETKRLELAKMMKRMKRKEYDALLVWKLDRLARSMQHLLNIVHGELQPRDIQFISLTEGFDTTTPAGSMIFHVLGALSQFEHDLIAERVKAGMARAKAQGKPIGRKRSEVDVEKLEQFYFATGSVRMAAKMMDGINPGLAWKRLNECGALGRYKEITKG